MINLQPCTKKILLARFSDRDGGFGQFFDYLYNGLNMTDPTQKQRLIEAVAILAEYNRWRRGDYDDNSPMPTKQPDPRAIGQAIDTLVELGPIIFAGLP